jgi:hypothetical protein
MYGFSLTIYLLSGWPVRKFPGVNPLGHDLGHLWYTLLGFKGDPHSNPIHIASNLLIIGGFFLLSAAWRCSTKRCVTVNLPRAGHALMHVTRNTLASS